MVRECDLRLDESLSNGDTTQYMKTSKKILSEHSVDVTFYVALLCSPNHKQIKKRLCCGKVTLQPRVVKCIFALVVVVSFISHRIHQWYKNIKTFIKYQYSHGIVTLLHFAGGHRGSRKAHPADNNIILFLWMIGHDNGKDLRFILMRCHSTQKNRRNDI